MELKPHDLNELQACVLAGSRLLPRGAGTKTALSTPAPGTASLDLSGLRGMIEYEPGEYTFTALAGTPVREIILQLAAHNQYLPFDPLLVNRGATLGGTVAANASGPGRFHYGGVRDFLIGVRFVDSSGQLVRGGGKVVKNAAGFDLPKLMVGSLGSLGVLYELTFKVFPRPEAYATLQLRLPDIDAAMKSIDRALQSKIDLDAIDFIPDSEGFLLLIRIAGLQAALSGRMQRLRDHLGMGDILAETDEDNLWQAASELAWVPPGWSLVKVPLTPARVPALELALTRLAQAPVRRYSAAGQVAWLAAPGALDDLSALLKTQSLAGMLLLGSPVQARLGINTANSFARRVKDALDPTGRFLEV